MATRGLTRMRTHEVGAVVAQGERHETHFPWGYRLLLAFHCSRAKKKPRPTPPDLLCIRETTSSVFSLRAQIQGCV